MDISSQFFIKILHALAGRYSMNVTLEKLAEMAWPNADIPGSKGSIAWERENQAALLDILLQLECKGYIFLDSSADSCTITLNVGGSLVALELQNPKDD